MSSKPKVGIIGQRGMVGSVLFERMTTEGDFDDIDFTVLSTSQAGSKGPKINGTEVLLGDANDLDTLARQDVIITTQGSEYTGKVHPSLRKNGWKGFWIDSASNLRYEDDSVLILDPINRQVIDSAIKAGKKDLIGANCTVSTMLMGLGGLFREDLVEWANPATYQAVSGAGAKAVEELLSQMKGLTAQTADAGGKASANLLELDKKFSDYLRSDSLPKEIFSTAIAGSVLPWIDSPVEDGRTREEWKAQIETNKILGTKNTVVDGTCVRVGSMRSHAQAVTIKLKKDLPLEEIEQIIKNDNKWVDLVLNNKEDTLKRLTPVAVSGTLKIAVGRLRKLNNGPEYLNAFVVGDQLLWGAAEPLRRALLIVTNRM
ncbi:MAG TPA: aspartate-semialdehyde dehydrogenase [Candidatus Saccharimonadales bacterium]|nr:aspartate-semialdehyde dehydrogenase [Candidatus Saccharimonadales bacterium]